MGKVAFDSKILPDGHLYCPKKFAGRKDAHFKVIVTFEEIGIEASEGEVELAAVDDVSEDFLSQEELNYYLSLKEL